MTSEAWATSLIRSQQRLVFLRVKVHPRHGLDPAKMIVNFLDAGNILRRDDRRLPRLLVGNHATEMNITVTRNDAEPVRRPVIFLYGCDDMAANMVIVGRGIRDVASEFRNR